MGKNINYEGKAGNGQHTKMCNQIAIAGALSGACEALAYANAVGLDPQTSGIGLHLYRSGRQCQMSNVATRILKGDLQPGFFVKHFIKDMKLADEEALAEHTKLGMLEYVLGMYEKLQEEGLGDLGTQALIKHYKW